MYCVSVIAVIEGEAVETCRCASMTRTVVTRLHTSKYHGGTDGFRATKESAHNLEIALNIRIRIPFPKSGRRNCTQLA